VEKQKSRFNDFLKSVTFGATRGARSEQGVHPNVRPAARRRRRDRRAAGAFGSQKERAIPVLEALASLKLTVVLFVLSVVLVFCGTLAQIDYGIWAVVNKYFRWFYVWIPVQIFSRAPWQIPHWLGVWFPGGWTIGGLLLINVLAAHATRFKLSWRRSGILIPPRRGDRPDARRTVYRPVRRRRQHEPSPTAARPTTSITTTTWNWPSSIPRTPSPTTW